MVERIATAPPCPVFVVLHDRGDVLVIHPRLLKRRYIRLGQVGADLRDPAAQRNEAVRLEVCDETSVGRFRNIARSRDHVGGLLAPGDCECNRDGHGRGQRRQSLDVR